MQRKCERYWPDNIHDTYTPPETTLVVSFEEVQPFADYEIRKLVVTNVRIICSYSHAMRNCSISWSILPCNGKLSEGSIFMD